MKGCNIIVAVVFISALQSGPTTAQVTCPEGFSAVSERCLQFVLETMNWYDAETNCEALGGYLAILSECRVWADVVKRIDAQGMKGTSFWIGATDLAQEGVWLWLNGQSVEMGIPFWGWSSTGPEPDAGTDGNCAYMSSGDRHYFHDVGCTAAVGSICEVLATTSEQTDEELHQ